MALQIELIDESGVSIPNVYLKIDEVNIKKPNGVYHLSIGATGYSSLEAKNSNKPPVPNSKKVADIEVTPEIKTLLDSLLGYGYAKLKNDLVGIDV